MRKANSFKVRREMSWDQSKLLPQDLNVAPDASASDSGLAPRIGKRTQGVARNADNFAILYLRLALGVGFLSAVADRFGMWGPAGKALVAWGNFQNFLHYTAMLNPWFPSNWVPMVGWIATICEALLGIALIVGFKTRVAAFCSGLLTLAFAFGMICGLGIKAPLNYSVFVVSSAAFLLSRMSADPWSVDSLHKTSPNAP